MGLPHQHYGRFLCLMLVFFTTLSFSSLETSSVAARPLSQSTATTAISSSTSPYFSSAADDDGGQLPPMFPGAGDDNNGFSSTFSPNFPGGGASGDDDDGFMNNMPPLPFGFPSIKYKLNRRPKPPQTPRQSVHSISSNSSVPNQEAIMGIQKEIVRAGTGPKPVPGQNVTVHCTGYGKNGDLSKQFWSTKDPGGTPFTFQIGKGKVIKGWDEGVLGMQVGEVARLTCSPDYGYGQNGFPAWGIQPNSVLIFEIEVLGTQ